MMKWSIAVVLATVFGLSFAGLSLADDAQQIQGRWKLVKAVKNGKERQEKIELIVTATDMTIVYPDSGKKEPIDYRLDPSKTPKNLDFVDKRGKQERVMPGIYELTGDALKLCYGVRPDVPRPTDFESKEGDGRNVMVLERIKDEKK